MTTEHRKEYQKLWHQKNRERRKSIYKARDKENYQWLQELKSTLCCSKCPENHIATLDFHHKDSSQKKFGIAHYAGFSRAHILLEIAKCDVICSNCHRKLHWEEKQAL